MFCHQTSGFTQTCFFWHNGVGAQHMGKESASHVSLPQTLRSVQRPSMSKKRLKNREIVLPFQRGVAFDLYSRVWTIPISVLIAYMVIFFLAESSFVGCYQPHTVTHHNIHVDHVLLISPFVRPRCCDLGYRFFVAAPCSFHRAWVASVAFFFCTSTTLW